RGHVPRRTPRPRGRAGSAPCATTATRSPSRGTSSRPGRCRPRPSPSTAATRRGSTRTGRRGRPPRPPRGAWGPSAGPLWQRGVTEPLVGAPPGEDGGQRLGENRDVEPDRPVLEVVEVEPDEVVEAQVDAAGHLPEPGHPGQDEIPLPVPVLELD